MRQGLDVNPSTRGAEQRNVTRAVVMQIIPLCYRRAINNKDSKLGKLEQMATWKKHLHVLVRSEEMSFRPCLILICNYRFRITQLDGNTPSVQEKMEIFSFLEPR